jgi:hypothetical protein
MDLVCGNMPIICNLGVLSTLVSNLAHELEMPQLCFPKQYTSEYHLTATFAPADEPDAVVPDPVGDARFCVHWSCFRGHLDPDDIAKLQGSPGMRQRWVEAWESAGPLLEEILKPHLHDQDTSG